jgi:hypothetical protein
MYAGILLKNVPFFDDVVAAAAAVAADAATAAINVRIMSGPPGNGDGRRGI